MEEVVAPGVFSGDGEVEKLWLVKVAGDNGGGDEDNRGEKGLAPTFHDVLRR